MRMTWLLETVNFVQALTSNANLKGETGTPITHSEDK